MASKTFLLTNGLASGSSHGALQDAGWLAADPLLSGWVVGTTAGVNYALAQVLAKPSVFGATAQPAGAPGTDDCWRSASPLNGTFAAGTWSIALSVIAVTAGASGTGKLRVRIWKSVNVDGSAGTELTTSTIVTTGWSNLTTAAAQNLTGSQSIAAMTFTNEYLFIQIACEIDTASGNASADVVLRADPANSKITTSGWTGATPANLSEGTTDSFVSGTRRYEVRRNGSSFTLGSSQSTYYKMRGRDPDCSGVTYRTWIVQGQPDTTGAQYSGPRCGASPLVDIVVEASWTV